MTELFWEIAGGWIRAALVALSTYLVEHHVVTADQGDKLTSEAFSHLMLVLPGLAAMAWTAIAKYRSRVKLLTALDLPSGSTEGEVKQRISDGKGAPVTAAVLVLAALTLGSSACAPKQYHSAVVANSAYARAVFALQDAEIITHTNHLISDAKHQEVKKVVAKLLRAGEAVTIALQNWQPGTPMPQIVAGAWKDASALLADVSALVPGSDPFLARIRDLIDVLQKFGVIQGRASVDAPDVVCAVGDCDYIVPWSTLFWATAPERRLVSVMR